MGDSFLNDQAVHECTAPEKETRAAMLRGFNQCKGNPGHDRFMTVNQFRQKSHSDLKVNENQMSEIWNCINRTVRIGVRCTSTNRPDNYPYSGQPYPMRELRGRRNLVRYATGFVCERLDIGEGELGIVGEEVEIVRETKCPCPDCIHDRLDKKGERDNDNDEFPHKKSFHFVVITATHVVFDTQEARHTCIDLFYDSEEDSKSRQRLYGVGVLGDENDRLETDRCFLVAVTHDPDLAQELSKVCSHPAQGFPIGVVASHPHGLSKRISMGKFLEHKSVLISKNKSFKLRKGTRMRFANTRDASLAEAINQSLGYRKPVLSFVKNDTHRTLELLRDVTIKYPAGFMVESDIHEGSQQVWAPDGQWWGLQGGLTFVTDGGKSYTLPICHNNSQDEDGGYILMSAFVKAEVFRSGSDDKDGDCNNRPEDANGVLPAQRAYFYSTYSMATCTGSSGALVHSSYHQHLTRGSRGVVHFGSHKGNSLSGLNTLDCMEF